MVDERTPPTNLAAIRLPFAPSPPDDCLYRIHLTARKPRHYGTGLGYRFNAPDKAYGVCYLAYRPAGAFAETLLRQRSDDFVPWEDIEARSLASFQLSRPLRLIPMYGKYLSQLHTNATTTTGRYRISQAWSRALYSHHGQPDGIAYRAPHDNDEIAVALFDRADNALNEMATTPLTRRPQLLAQLFERYQLDA